MNPPELFSGTGTGNSPSPRKELQLQGPRPSALKVNKDSHKIRKPPIAPPPHHHHPPPSQPQAPPRPADQPVIIYSVSPKVIHTTVTDFMKLVQRLTGDLSPAARLASIEKSASPKEREISVTDNYDDIMSNDFLVDADVELQERGIPGILSPAPASFPPISPGFFSPAAWDPFNMFIPSPATLFSAPMVRSPSPSFSSCDLFNPFFDF